MGQTQRSSSGTASAQPAASWLLSSFGELQPPGSSSSLRCHAHSYPLSWSPPPGVSTLALMRSSEDAVFLGADSRWQESRKWMQSPQGPVVSRSHFCHSPASTLLGLHAKGVPPAAHACCQHHDALPPAVRGGGQQESSIPAVAGPWRVWEPPHPGLGTAMASVYFPVSRGFLFVLQTHQGSLVSGTGGHRILAPAVAGIPALCM